MSIEDIEKNKSVWQQLSNLAQNNAKSDFISIQNELNNTAISSNINGNFDTRKIYAEFVIDNFLKNDTYVLQQQKLHLLNKLAGKIYNPIGQIMSIREGIVGFTGDSALDTILDKAIGDLVGGGIDTTDGKTFAATSDNDSNQDFFESADEFGNYIEGGLSVGREVIDNFTNAVNSAVFGEKIPTKTIMAQALAFKLKNDFTPIYLEDKNGVKGIQIEPLGENAISFIKGKSYKLENPSNYTKLKLTAESKKEAQNYRIKRSEYLKKEGVQYKSYKVGNNPLSVLKYPWNNIKNEGKKWFEKKKKEFDNAIEFFKKRAEDENKNENLEYFQNWNTDERNKNLYLISNYVYYIKNRVYSYEESVDYNREPFDIEKIETIYDNKSKIPRPFDYIPESSSLTDILTSVSLVSDENKPKIPKYPDISFIYKNRVSDDYYNFKSLKEFSDKNLENLDENNINKIDLIHNKSKENIDFKNLKTEKYSIIIHDLKSGYVAYFNPTVQSFSEDLQIQSTQESYIGRTENLPVYDRTARNISISFTIYSTTPTEYLINKRKLDFLRSLAYPQAISKNNFSIIKNPIIRFTFGDDFKNVGAFVNNISINPNMESMWESRLEFKGAKILDIAMSLTVIHDEMPIVYNSNNFDGTNDSYRTNNIYRQFINNNNEIKIDKKVENLPSDENIYYSPRLHYA